VAGWPLENDRLGRDGLIAIWDAPSGRELLRLEPLGGRARSDSQVTAAAFSADARLLAVACVDRHSESEQRGDWVFLHDAASGTLLRKFRLQTIRGPQYLAFSPDGELLVTSSTRADPVQLWRVADASEYRTLTGPTRRGDWSHERPAAFSP